MKNEQNNWVAWVAVIALVVAVLALAFVLKGGVTGNAINPANITIRANSCDKDSVCEMRSVFINSSKEEFLVKTDSGGYFSLELNRPGTNTNTKISSWAFQSTGAIKAEKLTLTNPVTASNGTKYYLCIDSAGQVLKSSTSCA